MSNPKVFPPIIGTQSGTSKEILFSPSIIVFKAVIIQLIGAFTISPKTPKIPLNISTTPCHALSQSPVKTPTTKSTIPPRMSLMLSMIEVTVSKIAWNTFVITSSPVENAVVNIWLNQSYRGTNTSSHSHLNAEPSASNIPKTTFLNPSLVFQR